MSFRQQSITQYYPSVGHFPQQQTTDYFTAALEGIKVTTMRPPIVVAAQMIKKSYRPNGVGFGGEITDPEGRIVMALAIGLIVGSAALAYQAGKAMAPTPKDKTRWGLIGIPVGLFSNLWGLGVMGIISNVKKG